MRSSRQRKRPAGCPWCIPGTLRTLMAARLKLAFQGRPETEAKLPASCGPSSGGRAEDVHVFRTAACQPALRALLLGEVSEVLSGGEVLVGEADGAAQGAGLDQVDDCADVAVEAAVAVDERGYLADEGVGGADGG